MIETCTNCGKELKHGDTAFGTTTGTIRDDGFRMDIAEPWEDIVCQNCYIKKDPNLPKQEIVVTVEGGVIQAISNIPSNCKVVVIDYDTHGIPMKDLTMIKQDKSNPDEIEYHAAIVSIYDSL